MDVVAKNVALERIRSTLALLKKSNVANELVVNGKPVVSVLKELQSYLRYNDISHLEAKVFLLPFLHVLGSRTISGPYVRNALDAIQGVLRAGLFSKWQTTSVTESLRQIASTVISCKFIHTDVAGDELVQVQLIETLRCLVGSSAAPLLNEQTQWQIIEFCCLTVAKTGGNPNTMLLNQTAERAVYDAVDLLLSLAVQTDGEGATASDPSSATLCKLLEYCVRVLKEAAGAGGKPEQSATSGVRSSTPPVHHRSLAQSASGAPLPLNEATGDKTTLHVLFVLRLLKSFLTNAAHSDRVRVLIVRSPEFVRLVGDELGFSLLQLSGGSAGAGAGPGSAGAVTGTSTPARSNGGSSPTLGAQLLSMPSGPPVVLSAVLGVFEALMHVTGPALRILVEGFARQVYLRALVQVYSLFKDQVQFLGEGSELVCPMVKITGAGPKGSASASATSSSHSDGGFRLDELECILESFSDLLSDPSLLGSWFASFDCDPVSADLVQPLVEYTCRAACLAWTFSTEFSSGYFKEIATLVVQLYRHTSKTLFLRCERRSPGGGLGAAPSAPIVAPIATGDSSRLASLASLFKATRGAKHVLAAAAALFVQKPEKGLKYLQERGSLPSPLTPEAVAAFLRLAPDLPKETTGAFLGELGKDDDKGGYEGSTKEFHRLVLLRYVESFEFADKGVLDCMRIFLSAFWLPGESQQIDRILSAFSQHCYSQCREGRQGILENADVTYVLTFSIIMLNTDRHNPNVRADRKMTLEQFIRNNTNYGRDSNQTVPLSREFLTSIFASIDEFPIRTEGKALAAVATSEEWADSHLQARADPRRGVLISTQRNDVLLRNMLDADGTAAAGREPFESILRELSPEEAPHGLVTPASIVRRLLVSQERTSCVVHPLLLVAEVSGHHGVLDADLLSCIWLDMLRGALCVHIHNAAVMQRVLASELERDSYSDPAADRLPTVMKHSQLRKLISSSNSLLAELLTVATNHRLHCVLDCANLVLLSCTGMMRGPLVANLQEMMCWDADEHNEPTKGAKGSQGSDTDKAPGLAIHDSTLLLYQFRHFESARLAVSTLLTVIHNYQSSITQWNVVWFFLGGLRDCCMLPRDMIEEGEADLLPPNIRDEFETVLLEMDRRTFEQRKPVAPKRVRRQSSSILSLQGLGEALFGGSAAQSDDGGEDSPSAGDGSASDAGSFNAYSAELANFKHAFKLDAVSARWDAGYEGNAVDSPRPQAERLKATSGEGSQMPPLPGSSQKARAGVQEGNTIPAFAIVDGGATIQELRTLVATCHVAQLVPDSRFLPENSLDAVLRSLVCVTECKDETVRAIAEFAEAALAEVSPEPEPEVSYTEERWSVGELLARCTSALQGRQSFSSASVAWLEMVLVEVSLRNRDRFQSFWPILKHHYIRSLCGSSVQLSYITERRVLGILKICTRMISRDHFSGAILELLGRIFARQGPSSPSISAGASQKGGAVASPVSGGSMRRGSMSPRADNDEDDSGYTLSKPQFPPMASQLLLQLSNQIAASMWRVLTLNVDILPLLPLEQWQTLFTIIAISAAAGGFAAIKSFEAMAWLLHEPRLVAKVPVFCIIGVRPLLRNPQAPLSVSVGAVHLLTHLHCRLEVLIREDKEDYVDCELDETSVDGDTPILWESCWTPILRALSEGIADTRAPVREACAEALCQAILDRHSHAVPAGVLVDILGHIIAPMIVQLRDHLVEEVNRALPSDVRKILTSKEAAALTQQQWVDVGAVADASAAEARDDPNPSEQGERNAAALRLSPLGEGVRPIGGGGTVSVLMECLSALCRSFLQHLRKLSVYPAFDKLWLCILAVLGHFLDNSLHGTAELAGIMQAWDSLPESTRLLVQDLSAMLDSSKDHLLRMLRALKQENVFRGRPGLVSVSRDMIRHFEDNAEALAELQGV